MKDRGSRVHRVLAVTDAVPVETESMAANPTGSAAQQDATPPRVRATWEKAFLAGLSKLGTVTDACAAARIERSTAYRAREAHPDFKQDWDEAREAFADRLEKEAIRRATKGVRRAKYYKDTLLCHEREYSDTLLLALLRANNPQKFKERMDVTSGDEKIPIAVVNMPVDEL